MSVTGQLGLLACCCFLAEFTLAASAATKTPYAAVQAALKINDLTVFAAALKV
jgi:hypothetical protein